MLIGLVIALTWSLSSNNTYSHVTRGEVVRNLQSWGLDSLHAITLNLLLTLFFLVIGLELAREIQSGRLANWSSLATPLFAALGGMACTAIPLLIVGRLTHSSLMVHGWGIPMATDIALTLGALTLLGPRVPASLRLFVLTLAVLDDVGSVIALEFVHPVTFEHWVLGTGALAISLLALRWWRKGYTGAVWIALAGAWIFCQRFGIEPVLAGVFIGMWARPGQSSALLEKRLTHLSSYFVLPLFTFVATGIVINSTLFRAGAGRVLLSILLIRLLGKALGIAVGVRLSESVGGVHSELLHGSVLVGVGFLCAIGFTVPLVFASAIAPSGTTLYNAITIGLLLASVLGAALGLLFLSRGLKQHLGQLGS